MAAEVASGGGRSSRGYRGGRRVWLWVQMAAEGVIAVAEAGRLEF